MLVLARPACSWPTNSDAIVIISSGGLRKNPEVSGTWYENRYPGQGLNNSISAIDLVDLDGTDVPAMDHSPIRPLVFRA